MDVQKLTTLNHKIIDAVECISRLRKENAELKRVQIQLSERVEEQDSTIQSLHDELDPYKSDFRDLEDVVKQSIDALSKLEKELQKTDAELSGSITDTDTTGLTDATAETDDAQDASADTIASENTAIAAEETNGPKLFHNETPTAEATTNQGAETFDQSDQDNTETASTDLQESDAPQNTASDDSEEIPEPFASELDKKINHSTERFFNEHRSSEEDTSDSNQPTAATDLEQDLYTDFVNENSDIKKNNEVIDTIAVSDEHKNAELADSVGTSLHTQEVQEQPGSLWDVTFTGAPNSTALDNNPAQKDESESQDHFSLFDFPNSSQ